MKKPICINLLGGSCSGKSTVSSYIFYKLKTLNYKVEYITEFAKSLTYQKSFEVLSNQIYVFAHQHQRMYEVKKYVDILVCDSPLLISLNHIDSELELYLKPLILHEYNKYRNINILLERTVKYETYGRNESEEHAIDLDIKMKKILEDNNLEYISLNPLNIEMEITKIIYLI
jgi:nicotinamide riboside kinase